MEPTGSSVRQAAHGWIEENFDPQLSLRAWLERLADSGWAQPAWPADWYGRGLPPDDAVAAYEEFNRVDAPGPRPAWASCSPRRRSSRTPATT